MVIHVPLKNDGWKTIITIVFLKCSLFTGDIPSFSGIPSKRPERPPSMHHCSRCLVGFAHVNRLQNVNVTLVFTVQYILHQHMLKHLVQVQGAMFDHFFTFCLLSQNPPALKTGCL